MNFDEAQEWLTGKRSMVNSVPQYPIETYQERVAAADAAMTQMAYWVAKAHSEKLVDA